MTNDMTNEWWNPAGLRVQFQPIYELEPQRIWAYEALGRGPVGAPGPRTIIEWAHANGRLVELEHGWRRIAIRTIAHSRERAHAKFFLNVDPRIIHCVDFRPGFTKSLLELFDLRPEQFAFELTESGPLIETPELGALISHYKTQGFGIALDDIGQGFSSLSAVVRLRPNILKIDRDLVDGIARDGMRQHLIASLVTFAEQCGMSLIAEGIETPRDLVALINCGVRYGQGFLLALPGDLSSDDAHGPQPVPLVCAAESHSR